MREWLQVQVGSSVYNGCQINPFLCKLLSVGDTHRLSYSSAMYCQRSILCMQCIAYCDIFLTLLIVWFYCYCYVCSILPGRTPGLTYTDSRTCALLMAPGPQSRTNNPNRRGMKNIILEKILTPYEMITTMRMATSLCLRNNPQNSWSCYKNKTRWFYGTILVHFYNK